MPLLAWSTTELHRTNLGAAVFATRSPAYKWQWRLVPWAVLLVLAVLPYLNSLQADFVFDDWIQIRGNPAVKGNFDWVKILAVPLFPGNLYRPLTVATFALDHAWFGWTAWWFHAVNVALHAAVAVLVFAVGRRLFPARTFTAWLAAAIFAVHPVHTEAVTGLVGRAELLAALFGLVTLIAALRAQQALSNWGYRGWMAVALGSFTAAFLAKESALVLLVLTPLYRMAVRGDWFWQGCKRELRSLDWLGFTACAAAVLVLRAITVGILLPSEGVDPADNILASVPSWQRIATAMGIQWLYFSQFGLPLVLSADYSYPQLVPVESWLSAWTLLGGMLLCASLVVATRWPGPVAFAALFPIVSFALTANILFPIGTIRGERLAYFPSVGWCWWLAGAVIALRKWIRGGVLGFLVVLLLCGYGVRTFARNADWRDQFALFANTAAVASRSAKAQKNYAIALRDAGRYEDAVRAYERAWSLYPREEGIAFGLGEVNHRLGRHAEAERWYYATLALNPRHFGAWNNLCQLYCMKGRWVDAERACRSGLRVRAAHANLWKGLGLAWWNSGAQQKGLEAMEIALSLTPHDQELAKYVQTLRNPLEESQ